MDWTNQGFKFFCVFTHRGVKGFTEFQGILNEVIYGSNAIMV